MKIVINKDNRIKGWDWLLLIGLILAPMTGLRVWKIGPAELLCFIWGLRYLLRKHFVMNETARFFGVFLASMLIGSLVCRFVAPGELRISGLATWFYIAIIACSIYIGLSEKSLAYNNLLLRWYARFAVLWYLLLYLYSRSVSSSFFGAPLWFHGSRFSGGASNPHQIAVMLCGLPFVLLRDAGIKKKWLVNGALVAADVFLLGQTHSSTGALAIALGGVIYIYLYFLWLYPHKKILVTVITLSAGLLIFLLGYSYFYRLFYNWISSDENGLGRLSIFISFPGTFMKSPVFGLGPGVHAMNGYIEFHNTYLEIMAATGLIGGIAFLVYSIRYFKTLLRADWRFVPVMMAMYAYGLAGFAMRRLVYWGILIMVGVIAEQMRRSSFERV